MIDKSNNQKPSLRNSLPPFLIKLQSSLESTEYIQNIIKEAGCETPEYQIQRIRRNYKFRKLILNTVTSKYIVYIHYTPRGLRNLSWFLTLAPKLGLNTPQLLSANTSFPYYIRHASVNLVTNYINGEIFTIDTAIENLDALGNQFARLHSKRSPAYGPLMTNLPVVRSPFGSLSHYWSNSIDQISQVKKAAAFLPKLEIMRWLQSNGKILKDFKQFNLCHGDPAGGNFLHQPDGSVYLIDCDHINYGFGAMEIATALLQNYCAGDMQRRERLMDSYLIHCSDVDRLIWNEHNRFFIAIALFRLSQRKIQWSNKCRKSGNNYQLSLAKGLQYWETFNQLISKTDGSKSWQSIFEDYDQIVVRHQCDGH